MFELRPRREKILIRGILHKDRNVFLLKDAKKGKYVFPGGIMSDSETVEQVFEKAVKKDACLEKAKLGNFINTWSFVETKNNVDYYYSVLDFELSVEKAEVKAGGKYFESKWISESEIDNESMDESQKKTLHRYFAWLSKK